jgi:vancomycin permeability regulator SanA
LALAVLVLVATWACYRSVQDDGLEGLLYYEYADELPRRDLAVVPGAAWEGHSPSLAMAGRLNRAIDLYRGHLVGGILVSGGPEEAESMRAYLLNDGIPAQDVWVDPQGLSTWDSLCRADAAFPLASFYFCTQEQYAGRAGYLMSGLDMEGGCINADLIVYQGTGVALREYLAASKAVADAALGVRPAHSIAEQPIVSADDGDGGGAVGGGGGGRNIDDDTGAPASSAVEQGLGRAPIPGSEPSSASDAGYDSDVAVTYARRFAKSRNRAYAETDQNCTSFVSQCLVAGGLAMDDSPQPQGGQRLVVDDAPQSWYSSCISGEVGSPPSYRMSTAFCRTSDFCSYWTKSRGMEERSYDNTYEGRESLIHEAYPGCVVLLYDSQGQIAHLGLVSRVEESDVWYCGNTSDRLDFSVCSLSSTEYPTFGVIFMR